MSVGRRVVAVALAGLVVAVVVAVAVGEELGRAAFLVGVSAGAGALVLAVARGVLSRPRAASTIGLRTGAVVIALVPVAAFGIGALAAARAMFVSPADLRALVVITAGAGTVGLVGALGMAFDLERARAAADAAAERERALERSRRELVAWVSHDLRTPLAGIRAMAEALDDEVVTDRATVERYHRSLLDETDRLARLVDDLFELSRIQSDAVDVVRQPVSLVDVVSDALDATEPVARAKDITLAVRLEEAPARVLASPREVARVVRNLLDNAVRHTPSGGRIVVEVVEEGDHAVVAVADECGGIAATEIDDVFDVAYRGDAARSPVSDRGGGLGLAIARGLVEAHAGDITVCNEGAGCRFTVRIPRAV